MSEKTELEVVGYLVDLPDEPELGRWLDEEAEEGEQMCRHQALVRQADAERVINGLSYQAELYDEVWGKARSMGFSNVTMALAEIDQLRAEVEASRLLLEQCSEVIADDGGVYIELRAFLNGRLPASEVIALLGAAIDAKS